MKKVAITLILAIMLLAVPASLFAVLSGDPIQTFDCPFLLTSGGQGAGSKMLRLLINQSKKFTLGEDADFWLEDETPERYAYIDSGRYTTLVIVISVTEKGLGASGITIEDEIGFLKEVLAKAKAKNMKIVAVSMEADARAPKLPTNGNERIIDLVCPQSDWIISLKANNADDRFTKISQQYGIPLTIIDKPMDLVQAAPKIFIKK
ncbi:MAG: hypothetical protein IIU44_03530 [Spirochaetales bacterium]|jgi:hypothetical protein|nr:hypothetical protein [Spirochaetales bacterium]